MLHKIDAQYPYPNGWTVNVEFLPSNLHNIEVVTPRGHALELRDPGLTALGPLKESIAALYMWRVRRLSGTDTDEQAKSNLLAEE